mmetsp:Transcript_18713/g.41653  ORF Transcript_18713/g.41653 Transcript_18713/m.41653 type:complete len:512 (+) Transcript_18713:186-1721(+)
MGGGVSTTATTRIEKRENIRDRNKLVRDVEKFILNVYSTCSRSDAMWLLLWNQRGVTAFGHFVESERADEYFTLFNETNKVRKVLKPNVYVLRKYMKTIIKDYIEQTSPYHITIAARLKRDMESTLTDKLEEVNNPVEHIFSVIMKLQIEMVRLMARDQLNRFLFSKFYKNWRAYERGRAIASNGENCSHEIKGFYRNHPKAMSSCTGSERSNGSSPPPRKTLNDSLRGCATFDNRQHPEAYIVPAFPVVVPEDALSAAFVNFDAPFLNSLLDWQSWMSSLLGSVEILPVAFSLARAKSKSLGYQLVYVNKHFESSFGFKRSSVLGWDCKDFLHCPETEKKNTADLAEGLRNKEQVSSILTSVRGDGTRFKQLLVLRPVLDEKGALVLVMGVHFEITDAEAADPQQLRRKAAEDLLATLPDIIVKERNEDEVPVCLEWGLQTFLEVTRFGPDREKLLAGAGAGASNSGEVVSEKGSNKRSDKEQSLRGAVEVTARRRSGGSISLRRPPQSG